MSFSSDSKGEELSETNSSVSDEGQLGENSSVARDRGEASASSCEEEPPISPVLSSSLDIVNTCEEEQIQTSPTSEPLLGGIRVSQISVLSRESAA